MIEEIVQAADRESEVELLFNTLNNLLLQELSQPPSDDSQTALQVQSLLTILTTMLKTLKQAETIDSALDHVIEVLNRMTTHASANVWKALIFLMVDVSFMVDEQKLQKYMKRFGDNQ